MNASASRNALRAGKAFAAAGVVLGATGVVGIVAMGRWDHLPLGTALFGVFAVGFGSLAWLAYARQPHNPALLAPAFSAFVAGMSGAAFFGAVLGAELAGFDVSAPAWAQLAPAHAPPVTVTLFMLGNFGPVVGLFLMLTLWPLVFPDGRLPSSRWRWVVGATFATMAALLFVLFWVSRPSSTIPYGAPTSVYPPGIPSLADPLYGVLMVLSFTCVASLVRRYRRSLGEVRQQYLWVLLGTAFLYFAMLVVDQFYWNLLAALAGIVASVVCYGVAVTKHRLYDIDVVVSRTIVYGTLAVFIGGVYVLVVVAVGELIGAQAGSLTLSVAATALVAIAFDPVRQKVQRWANRVVYGQRSTPYEVLADVAHRLAAAEPVPGVLERMAHLVAEGTGAEQATVWLREGDGLVAAAGCPTFPQHDRVESEESLHGVPTPVYHNEEMVGVLEVEKPRGSPVTPTEQRLLADLAGSAGLVLGNQRLNSALAARAAELRASRRRLVELQDSERRRLERDLHDGAQQQVVALKLKIALAERMARKADAGDLANTLSDLATETQEALDDIRRLARGLYPQLLEYEDIATAVRSHVARLPVPVEVVANGVAHYPREVEAAVYFAAVEAIANSADYSDASQVAVSLVASDEAVTVEVRDNGRGFDVAGVGEGIGLTNIRDRVEALGGEVEVESAPGAGTTVRARIPLESYREAVLTVPA